MTTVQNFLNCIYPEVKNHIEIRAIQRDSGKIICNYYQSREALNDDYSRAISHLSDGGFDIYIGVCPRDQKDGSKKSIKASYALWLDVDAKNFIGGKEEALQRLCGFELPPTAIIDSGNGYHAYWRLDKPFIFETPSASADFENLLKRFCHHLNADSAACEIARILRLPGTKNWKDRTNPLPVSIVHINESAVYDILDFEEQLLSNAPHSSFSGIYKNPGWVSELLTNLRPGNRNDSFTRLAGLLHRQGFREEDINSLLAPHAQRSNFEAQELEKIIHGIVTRYPQKTSLSLPIYEEKQETEPKQFCVMTASSLMEQKDQEISWIIQGILPEESVGILAGPAGLGKSWMLLEAAMACATGGKFLGEFPTNPGRVLYIDEESALSLVRRRLGRLIKEKNLDTVGVDIHFAIGQGLSLSQPESLEALREQINALKPKLVVTDSLIRVHDAEENSASEMSKVFAPIKSLVRDYRCSFLFADHQKKPTHFGSGGPEFLLRGSSEKIAFVDTLISLKKKGELIIAEHSKSRYAVPVPAFIVEIVDVGESGTKVTYVGNADDFKKAAKLEAAGEFIVAFLRDKEWVSRKEIVAAGDETEFSEKTIDECLRVFEKEGIVERQNRKAAEGRGGKAAFYRLILNNDTPISSPLLGIETETETE